MSVYRILNIQNKGILTRFREFLSTLWEQGRLDALLAPVELPDGTGISIQAIEDPGKLWAVNPFTPLMLSNSAAQVSEFSSSHPKGRLAVILRPCELSTLVEIRKRNRFSLHPSSASDPAGDKSVASAVVTIGVDCTGTYELAEHTRSFQGIEMESLFRQPVDPRIVAEPELRPLRLACQLCDRPAPNGADIAIGTIGVAQPGYLLVISRDMDIDVRLGLGEATDGFADESDILRRDVALAAIAELQVRKWTHWSAPGYRQSGDLGRFLANMARCTLCADCLDACPLYHGELAGMLGVAGERQPKWPQLSEWIEVNRWLASCTGCGMCAEACANGVPLLPVILNLSRHIRAELNYSAGDPLQPLPWD